MPWRFLEQIRECLGRSGQDSASHASLSDALAQASVARRRMTEANLRLVIFIARRYKNSGVPLLDLIQEGNIGLMRAVDKYDYHRGVRFATYAMWWIRQSISRYVACSDRVIRIPVQLINRVERARAELTIEAGYVPNAQDIATYLSMPI